VSNTNSSGSRRKHCIRRTHLFHPLTPITRALALVGNCNDQDTDIVQRINKPVGKSLENHRPTVSSHTPPHSWILNQQAYELMNLIEKSVTEAVVLLIIELSGRDQFVFCGSTKS